MKTVRFIDTNAETKAYAEFMFSVRSNLVHLYCMKDGYETTIRPTIDNVLATSPSVIYGDFLEKKKPENTAEYLARYLEILLETDVPLVSPL